MTYQEFRKIVEDTEGYYIDENMSSIFVNGINCASWCIRISKNVENFTQFKDRAYRKDDGDLIRAVLELAETPLGKREPEKRYYLKHKFIVPKFRSSRAYLILNYDLYYLGSLNRFSDHQSIFTKKEIEEIKKKFDVTLEDFEMIEVEDE